MSRRTLVLVGLAIAGCGSVQRERFRIELRTESDDGRALQGVAVYHGNRLLGRSLAGGRLNLAVDAVDGDTLPLRFTCPAEFRPARDRVGVRLRGTTGRKGYSVALTCLPERRTALLAIDTNMAGVPVVAGQEVVATTNEFGAAHLALPRAGSESFEIMLDTTADPFLRPQNPIYQFRMPDRDQAFAIQQTFAVEKPPPAPPKKKARTKSRRRAAVVKPPPRPVKLTGGSDFGSVGD